MINAMATSIMIPRESALIRWDTSFIISMWVRDSYRLKVWNRKSQKQRSNKLPRSACQPIAEALIADALQLTKYAVDRSSMSPAMVMSNSFLRDIQRLRWFYKPPRLTIILKSEMLSTYKKLAVSRLLAEAKIPTICHTVRCILKKAKILPRFNIKDLILWDIQRLRCL